MSNPIYCRMPGCINSKPPATCFKESKTGFLTPSCARCHLRHSDQTCWIFINKSVEYRYHVQEILGQ